MDPYGGVKIRERDAQGRLAREVDSGGRELRWLYDVSDAHYARVDRFGNLFPPELEMPRLPNPFARTLPNTALGRLFEGVVPPSRNAMFGVDESLFSLLPPEAAVQALKCFRLRPPSLAVGRSSPPLGSQVERDAMGRQTREIDPIGRSRAWAYDATGNLVGTRDRDGRVATLQTVSWNLVGERRDALGNPMQYQYSRLEQIVGITDPLGNTTQYEYDRKERLVRVHENGRLQDEYVYDAGDHFIEKRDGQGAVVFTNEIHANHFVAVRHLASGGIHRFGYDGRGRITEASTEKHDVHLAYDDAGLVLRDVRDGKGLERRYIDGAWVTRLFDRFELRGKRTAEGSIELVDSAGKQTVLSYDSTGRVERRCGNGTVEFLQYDDEGRIEGRVAHKLDWGWRRVAWSVRYTYTAHGDLVEVDDSARGTTKYEVDAAHRLIGETTPTSERLTYWLDAAGNLRSKPGMPRIDVGPGNRLVGSADETFAYDDRDRLAERRHRDGSVVHYTYDSFDMLIRVECIGADGVSRLVWEADYDALGRRVRCRWRALADAETSVASGHENTAGVGRWRAQASEAVASESEGTREFHWDRDRLAAEVSANGRLRIYQYASREALVPLAFVEYESLGADPASGRSYQVFSDQVGMPSYIEDEERRVVWWADRVDPYGRSRYSGILNAAGVPSCTSRRGRRMRRVLSALPRAETARRWQGRCESEVTADGGFNEVRDAGRNGEGSAEESSGGRLFGGPEPASNLAALRPMCRTTNGVVGTAEAAR